MKEIDVEQIEKTIGYTFAKKELLHSALTHSSFTNEHIGYESYERLEYIGDSVISLIVANYLFNRFPYANQGFLSKIRSIIISEKCLSEVIEKLGLDKYLRISETLTSISPRLKGDIFESIAGAIFIDSNDINKAAEFILINLKNKLNAEYNVDNITDYKSALFEYAAKNGMKLSICTEKINDLPPKFKSTISLEGYNSSIGEGNSKKKAEQEAAKALIIRDNILN
ncbi:MAG: Ribonuclease 3 [Firmicutes bacterium ADurb.Bin080]|jgi:ribonuclease III|nr:ribonuclease III [Clostridiales bacterium]OQC12678.1 MAG: Ribonuclease 3 [Firmicutes bacterium ADurb.Bin080]